MLLILDYPKAPTVYSTKGGKTWLTTQGYIVQWGVLVGVINIYIKHFL